VLLKEQLGNKRFDREARDRIVGVVSSWDAALETFGDRLARVVLYCEDGNLTFKAFDTVGWHGELGGSED